MKQIFLAVVALLSVVTMNAQNKAQFGEKFSYVLAEETNPQIVLADSYNHYLLSITNVDGMLASHKVTVRKFDQKSQLVDTYTQEFKKLDNGTLYNYLGTKELSNTQVAVFAESYSGKEKKKDIYQYLFDKGTGKFTTTLVVSYPIESAMKSGTTTLATSDNGRYVGFINKRDGKSATADEVLMLDGSSAAVLWKKEVPQEDKTYIRAFTVTNSGKAVLLKAAKGLKLSNKLAVVTKDNIEEKLFDEEVMLHNPKAVSIGQADYLVDFNFAAKGLRSGDFEKFMLYDLGSGKILKNNTVKEWNAVKDITEANVTNVIIQNNELHIFTEAKAKAGTRQVKVNPMSSMTFDEPYYRYGPSHLIVMNLDGTIKSIKPFSISTNGASDFYHSFGLLNLMGKYYINAGGPYNLYELPYDDTKAANFKLPADITNDPYKNESPYYVPQVMGYVKDTRKVILCRMHYDNKMSLLSLADFPVGN